MGDLLGSPHLVVINKIVRWKPFTGQSEQYCVEVGGVLQVVSEPLPCRSGYGANLIQDDESLRGVFVTP